MNNLRDICDPVSISTSAKHFSSVALLKYLSQVISPYLHETKLHLYRAETRISHSGNWHDAIIFCGVCYIFVGWREVWTTYLSTATRGRHRLGTPDTAGADC